MTHNIEFCVCFSGVLVCVVLGVPLTPSNVMREVREVEDWWGERGLGDLLWIPQSKIKEIRQNFPDEMEQKKQLITYWINTDPLASWRRLIMALDSMKETKTADSIRSYAEPLTGMYCSNEKKGSGKYEQMNKIPVYTYAHN